MRLLRIRRCENYGKRIRQENSLQVRASTTRFVLHAASCCTLQYLCIRHFYDIILMHIIIFTSDFDEQYIFTASITAVLQGAAYV